MNLTFAILLILSFLISNHFSSKRNIGFLWSLFFCIFFSPLIGWLVIESSGSKSKPEIELSKEKKVLNIIVGLFFIIISFFLLFRSYGTLITIDSTLHILKNDSKFTDNQILDAKATLYRSITFCLTIAIGFFGASIYMTRRIFTK